MYVIIDPQYDGMEGFLGDKFKTKADIIDRIANFHDIDYAGVKDNDEPYDDIWERLNELDTEEKKLDWLLSYGEWSIEKISDKESEEKCKYCMKEDIGKIKDYNISCDNCEYDH